MKELTKEDKRRLKDAWRTILSILRQTGYDFMYMDEIDTVASALRNVLDMEN